MYRLFVLVCVVAFLCPNLCAQETKPTGDVVILQNGDRLTGEILRCEDGNLIFASTMSGEVKIPWNNINGFESNRTLYFRMDKGNVISGQPAGLNQGRQVINNTMTGQMLIDRTQIVMIGDDEESVNQDLVKTKAELEKTKQALDDATKINKVWSGYLQLNFSGSTGNKDSVAFASIGHLERKAYSDKFEAHIEMRYGEIEDEISDQAIFGYLRETVDITSRLYVYGRIEGKWDEIKDIDFAVTVELGGGVHALKEGDWMLFEGDKVTLDFDLGATYTATDYEDGEDTHSSGAVIRMTYHHYFPNKWHLYIGAECVQDFQRPQNREHAGRYDGRRSKVEALLEIPITDYLSFTTNVRYEHNKTPAPGIKHNDFYWLMGIKVNL